MTNPRFNDVFIVSDSDGLKNIFHNPVITTPRLIINNAVATATGAITPKAETFTIVKNGWSSTSFTHCDKSNLYVDIAKTLSSADYPYIYSGYDSTTHTIKDLSVLATGTSLKPVFTKSNEYTAGITAVSRKGDLYVFTTTINARDRRLLGTRIKLANPDGTLTTIKSSLKFRIEELGSTDNVILCKALNLDDDYSEVTTANVAKLVIHFFGNEDLPSAYLYLNTTAVTDSSQEFLIYNT